MSAGDAAFDLSDEVHISTDGFPKSRTTFQIDFEDLEILHDDELGSGSFSKVCKGIYCGTEVAIKKIKIPKTEPELMKYLKREVLLLNALKHPYVVQFLGWCHPEDSEYLLLVEEFIRGGNLSNFLLRNDILISWDTRINICLDIARAMLYLHKRKVIYRDLKSENVLVDDAINPRIAKLCDFGLARSIADFDRRNGPPMTICGTDEWMAPEVILGMDYDERSDVFSYGIVLLECILGPAAIKTRIERTPANFFELDTDLVRQMAEKTACPKDLVELSLFCCAYEPNARPDFHEILILLMNIAAEAQTVHYEEIKIDEIMAEALNSNLSKTRSVSHEELLRDLNSSTTSIHYIIPDNNPTNTTSTNNNSNNRNSTRLGKVPEHNILAEIVVTASVPLGLPANTINKIAAVSSTTIGTGSVSSSGNTSQNSSNNNLRKLLEAPSIFSLDPKAEYVRVESMVDSYTHWNVRIGPGATVKDVCDKIIKKIDEKYKVIQLYIIQGKKKVMLGSDQTITNVTASFGDEKSFKFGVNYLTGADTPSNQTTNQQPTRGARKDASNTTIQRRKSSLFGTITKKGKKNLPETPLIKSI